MKTRNTLAFLTLAAALSAWAATAPNSVQTRLNPGKVTLEASAPPQTQPANEFKLDGKTYSGVGVQLFNAPNPLQMVNPLAPASYGNGEQNVARDPIDHHVVGLKVLSVDF